MARFTEVLKADELAQVLQQVPRSVRLDIVQFALDLAGIVDQTGAADATNGFISLLRGDLVGAALSAGSILPLGDILKVGRFARYATSLRDLVSIALRQPQLAWALRTPMRQFRDGLNRIQGLMGDMSLAADMLRSLDQIREVIDRYFVRMIPIEKFGWAKAARKAGASSWQFVGHDGTVVTVNSLVDILEAAEGSSVRAVRDEAQGLMGRMALSDGWRITAGIHDSASDATRHITVQINGIAEQFHVRVDKRGHLFEITHGRRGESLSDLRQR